MKNSIKIEDLDINESLANEYLTVIREFLKQLNFSKEHISEVDCRRVDGFVPYDYNKGGLVATSYVFETNTEFDKIDELIEKSNQYDLEYFLESKNIKELDYNNDDLMSEFNDYQLESQEPIQLQARVMLTSETTANIDFYLSISDAPYYRKSDDKLGLDISFNNPKQLKTKLNQILKNEFVQKFKKLVE